MKDLLGYTSFEMRHLRLVVAVAEARSLTSAASRLHLTTSALSHQLRQLEELAGAAMFYREGRGMRPTRAGETLLQAARRALTAVHEGEEQLSRGVTREPEIIRLCTHCYTGYAWLPSIIAKFMHQSGGAIDVRISVEATRNPFEALRERKLDLVLTLQRPTRNDFEVQPLFQDDLLLLVPPGHRLAQRAWVDLKEIQQENLILHLDRIEESQFFRDYLAPVGIRPKRFTGMMLTEAVVAMVKAGLGVTVLPRWMARDLIAAGTLIAKRLTRRGLVTTWYTVTRKKPHNAAALNALIAQIFSHMETKGIGRRVSGAGLRSKKVTARLTAPGAAGSKKATLRSHVASQNSRIGAGRSAKRPGVGNQRRLARPGKGSSKNGARKDH